MLAVVFEHTPVTHTLIIKESQTYHTPAALLTQQYNRRYYSFGGYIHVILLSLITA
eukprot:COSAG01_NODE_17540_length_1142_cov_4.776606_1_plen_55_part_10